MSKLHIPFKPVYRQGQMGSGGTAGSDFDKIVDSYMPAARILMMVRSEIESAVLRAMRIERHCESCRYSRAPHSVVQVARGVGILPIYKRSCVKSPPRTQCPEWERLEIPQEFLQEG